MQFKENIFTIIAMDRVLTKMLDQQLPPSTTMEHLSWSFNLLSLSTSLTFLTASIPVLPDLDSDVQQPQSQSYLILTVMFTSKEQRRSMNG